MNTKNMTQDEINNRKAIATERETLTKNILHFIRAELEHSVHNHSDAEELAAYLYDLGYRKLDDYAIMVLRQAQGMKERIRKETAKEIYREIYLQSYVDDKRLCPSVEVWRNVLKKYGVEVEK